MRSVIGVLFLQKSAVWLYARLAPLGFTGWTEKLTKRPVVVHVQLPEERVCVARVNGVERGGIGRDAYA